MPADAGSKGTAYVDDARTSKRTRYRVDPRAIASLAAALGVRATRPVPNVAPAAKSETRSTSDWMVGARPEVALIEHHCDPRGLM